jgi:hypothetical protein
MPGQEQKSASSSAFEVEISMAKRAWKRAKEGRRTRVQRRKTASGERRATGDDGCGARGSCSAFAAAEGLRRKRWPSGNLYLVGAYYTLKEGMGWTATLPCLRRRRGPDDGNGNAIFWPLACVISRSN